LKLKIPIAMRIGEEPSRRDWGYSSAASSRGAELNKNGQKGIFGRKGIPMRGSSQNAVPVYKK
jgi:hypothetical protein